MYTPPVPPFQFLQCLCGRKHYNMRFTRFKYGSARCAQMRSLGAIGSARSHCMREDRELGAR